MANAKKIGQAQLRSSEKKMFARDQELSEQNKDYFKGEEYWNKKLFYEKPRRKSSSQD